MRAIILAAGVGRRLAKYTRNRPKCLLEIGGRSLLEWQIETLRQGGIDDIVVVKGYAAEKVNLKGARYYVNDAFANSNMVLSLFCAESEIEGNVIVSYGDILFQKSTLQTLLRAPAHEVLVAVDTLWKEYYKERSPIALQEAESLICDADGRILEIGRARPDPSDIQAQYIGLIRLSEEGCRIFQETYRRAKSEYWGKEWVRGRVFQQAYMTDFLQALIDHGVPVYSVPVRNGWLEFDTDSDYEKVLAWHAQGTLSRFFKFDVCEQALRS
jgi:choline kinase